MVKITVDSSGVLNAFNGLKKQLMTPAVMGKVMQATAAATWVPAIRTRLGVSTATSGYEQELNETMRSLDPLFVAMLAGQSLNGLASSNWADQTEAERRAPGGYNPGTITKAIESTIKASEPIKIMDGLYVGIGSLDELDNLFSSLGVEDNYKLWQILNYGTGALGAAGAPVIRTGKQIFYNRKIRMGILSYRTENPGFKGREFFVKMDNSMHESDYAVRDNIIRYMAAVVKERSYRK